VVPERGIGFDDSFHMVSRMKPLPHRLSFPGDTGYLDFVQPYVR
jgi:hypothetical protein